VQECFDEFVHYPGCDKIYWQGSHDEKMKDFVESLAEQFGACIHPKISLFWG
jgi:uncharacterized protein with PIN domain